VGKRLLQILDRVYGLGTNFKYTRMMRMVIMIIII